MEGGMERGGGQRGEGVRERRGQGYRVPCVREGGQIGVIEGSERVVDTPKLCSP